MVAELTLGQKLEVAWRLQSDAYTGRNAAEVLLLSLSKQAVSCRECGYVFIAQDVARGAFVLFKVDNLNRTGFYCRNCIESGAVIGLWYRTQHGGGCYASFI